MGFSLGKPDPLKGGVNLRAGVGQTYMSDISCGPYDKIGETAACAGMTALRRNPDRGGEKNAGMCRFQTIRRGVP